MDVSLAQRAETLIKPLKQQELTVPRRRLKKAQALLEKCKPYRAEILERRPDEKHKLLVSNLSKACPARVAHAEQDASSSEGRWYAAACRARGAALQQISRHAVAHGNPSQVLLLQPRIERWRKAADALMPSLCAKVCFPLDPLSVGLARNLVIVSDSTLQLPGVIFGLQREASLMDPPVRLLWIAVCPGGGAKDLANAWGKGPKCDYGLTVINLNDCIKGTVYSFTNEDRQNLNGLVR